MTRGGSSDDLHPTASRASTGYRQLETDPASRAPVGHPSAHCHRATGRADCRARGPRVPALHQLRSSPFFRSAVCETDHPRWHAGSPGRQARTSRASSSVVAPTEVVAVTPEVCPCGQREFPETLPYHTQQVIELPEIAMQVTHVVLPEARCPQCGSVIKAPLPADHHYRYGPRLTALIGELTGPQRDSRSAVQAFCTSVLGVSISRGAIQCVVDRVSDAITPPSDGVLL